MLPGGRPGNRVCRVGDAAILQESVPNQSNGDIAGTAILTFFTNGKQRPLKLFYRSDKHSLKIKGTVIGLRPGTVVLAFGPKNAPKKK